MSFLDMVENHKMVVENSGLLTVAALKQLRFKNKKVVSVLSGGNMDVITMMCGLQGAGKTTAAAKIAGKLKTRGKFPLLVACDIYRPAAIEQLQVNAAKILVDCFSMITTHTT